MHSGKAFMILRLWKLKLRHSNVNFVMSAWTWKEKEFGGTKARRSKHLPTSMHLSLIDQYIEILFNNVNNPKYD